MFFFTASLIIWLVLAIFLIISNLKHYSWLDQPAALCGPLASLKNFQDSMKSLIYSGPLALHYAYDVMSFYPLQLCVVLVLMKRVVTERNRKVLMERSLKLLIEE